MLAALTKNYFSKAGLTLIQPKLTINTPGDIYEQEADAMADRVMRLSANETMNQPKPTTGLIGRSVQRKCSHCEEEKKRPIMRKVENGIAGMQISSSFASSLNASKGSGSPLPQETKSFMENAFSTDFSRVKIHTDSQASEMNGGISAKAFTYGSDIYFNKEQYNPESASGKHLLAHELTHTLQQGGSRQVPNKANFVKQSISGRRLLGEEDNLAQNSVSKIQPKIQRSTAWGGAVVHESINLATMILGGNTPITWHILNGIQLTTDADADRAINLPTITTSGSGTVWHARVTTVPLQNGSADETVLASPPWSTATTKVNAGILTGLAACTGAGNSTFSANGSPSDISVFNANRRHENHHVADHLAAFNAEIGTWDTNLQTANTNATQFNGVSAAAATTALWAAMSGTPNEVARRYRAEGFRRGGVYHGTATGGTMTISNPQSNAICSISSVDVTNPA